MQHKTLVLAVALALSGTMAPAFAQDARDAEIAALKQQLADLAAKVQELSGMGRHATKEAEGNSDAAPSDSSASA